MMGLPFNATQIKEALTDRAEALFREAWDEPERPGARDWRARSDSARWMDMQAQRGRWQDHKTGEKGDILEFFAVYFCGLKAARDDFPRVLSDAARWAGIDAAEPFDRAELEARQAERQIKAKKAEADEARAKAATVAELRRQAQPIQGSPAAAYLAGRGIAPERLPDAVAYMPPVRDVGVLHPERAALAVWGTDDAGNVMGGHRVLILPDGSKAPEDPRRAAFGAIAGYPARFPAQIEGGPLCVAEGPETALAIWQATGFETWVVFGASGFEPAPVPTGRKVIFCPDRDAPDSQARKGFEKAIATHAARGVQVWIAEAPEPEGSKRDLNDTLQRAGADTVADAIAQAKPRKATGAHDPLPVMPSVIEARNDVQEALNVFWTQAQEGSPLHVLKVPTGVGKTRALIQMVGRVIPELRTKDDMRAVPIYAPDHKLNDQILQDFARYAPGVSVTVRRGREAKNPAAPGETMCRNLDAVKRAQRFVLDVSKTVCKSCPFATTCAYLESQDVKADVYIMPHASLPLMPPASRAKFAQGIAFAVIDESPDMIGKTTEMAVAALGGMRAAQNKRKGDRAEDMVAREADLRADRGKLRDMIEANGIGPLRAGLVREKFDADGLQRVVSAEWGRKIDDAGKPDAELEQNRSIKRMAAIWRELADLIENDRAVTARLVVRQDTEKGLVLQIRTLSKLHDDLKDAPLLLLDATARRDMIEATLGKPSAWIELEAAAPWMRVAQDASTSFSMTMLQADLTGKGTQAARNAAPNNRKKLVRVIREQSAKFRGQPGLVVTYKDTADAIRPYVPEGVTVMHFGGTRGRNDAEAVRWVLIAGRLWGQDPRVIEMAETLTGLPVEGRSEMIDAERRFTDGKRQWSEPRKVRGFRDPMAQACLDHIRDDDLIQALGRGRGVNRTEATPLDVLVIGDGFLSLPVHNAAGAWADMTKRDVIEEQLALGGIAYAGAKAAFTIYGTALRKSLDAVKQALHRLGDIPLLEPYRALSPSPMALVRLKRDKRAPCWTEALIDVAQHPDLRAAIEAQLGPLAAFDVIEAPQAPSMQGKEAPAPAPVSTMQESLPEPTHAPPKRLVMLPPDRQIKSPMLAEYAARRGQDDLPPRRFRPRSYWLVSAGRPFLMWKERLGAVLSDALPRPPASGIVACA
jgi:putative DNA primase/helicase